MIFSNNLIVLNPKKINTKVNELIELIEPRN